MNQQILNFPKTYIGIDNGISGGVVALNEAGVVSYKILTPIISVKKGKGNKSEYSLPAMVEILEIVKNFTDVQIIVLERAQSMPLQGVSSMFSIGKGFGMWQGIIAALKMPFVIVHPRTWQKEIFRDLNHKDTKQASIITAQHLCPAESWLATERSKKPHIGLTDAFCLAEYGRRLYK